MSGDPQTVDTAGVTMFTDPVDLIPYRRDASVALPGSPEIVFRPRERAEVAGIVAGCSARHQPLYVRGAGSMYAGGANPQAGGAVLDLSALDRILEIDTDRGVVVVEPGVRFGALTAALAEYDLTIGIIPLTGPAATIGGAISAHALGTGSARFQSIGDEVVGVEAVLTDGTVVRTGSAASRHAGFFQRYAIGPDLTGLFLGGDATLGVVTAIALWLHPRPETRRTVCFGFADAATAARAAAEIQNRDLTRNVWYGGGYEAATIAARMTQGNLTAPAGGWPQWAFGFDLGGDEAPVAADLATLTTIVERHGGALFPEFDAIYFRRLRYDETYWYSFAGYFVRSRCTLLMSSVATVDLPRFLDVIADVRARWDDMLWGCAAVVCRRGLHGAVIGFYDEATDWDLAREATADCAARLVAAGCVPYKSGKVWADQVKGFDGYHQALSRIKQALDPHGVLSPGNLGLGS